MKLIQINDFYRDFNLKHTLLSKFNKIKILLNSLVILF